LLVLLALIGLGAVVYGLPGALVGYVLGILVANLVPEGGASCALPPEPRTSGEDPASPPRAE